MDGYGAQKQDRGWLVDSRTTILGVAIADVTLDAAARHLARMLTRRDAGTHTVFFVNAHGLNLAWESPDYRALLNSADVVFGDGIGVRLAGLLQHIRLEDNVNGTDLVPELLRREAGKGYRLYMLGGRADTIERSVDGARSRFPGWDVAGWHHGYLRADDSERVIEDINRCEPNLLLVGMGNPIQEEWIHRHRAALRVPLTIAVGGLFAYWAGELERAPEWMRARGLEWLHILRKQPRKARRYLVGNPLFVSRILRQRFGHVVG